MPAAPVPAEAPVPAGALSLLARPFNAAQMRRLLVNVIGARVVLRPVAMTRGVEGLKGAPGVAVFAVGAAEAEARAYLKRVRLTVREEGGTVRVQDDARQQQVAGWWPWRRRQTARLIVVVALPDGCGADVRTSAGRIDAAGLDGRHTLDVTGGTVEARDLAGWLEVQARGGEVLLDGFAGEKLILRAAGSPATLRRIRADALDLALTSSDATLDGLAGAVTLDLDAGSADLVLQRGSLDARLQGSYLDAAFDRAAAATIRAAATPVVLALPPAAAATLALDGTTVALDERLAFAGERGARRVAGTLNGGGPALTVRGARSDVRCVPRHA